MSKKISEMTLEELQDHAQALQTRNDELTTQLSERDQTINDLNATNLALQQRNNRLFMQVESQTTDPTTPKEDPAEPESCEDFAKRTVKEIFS